MTRSQAAEVGFIGLGRMGSAMATNLAEASPLLVWNRTPAATKPLLRAGAEVAPSISHLFQRCSVIFLMLSDEAATDAVLRFDGSIPLRGKTVVQMSTVSPSHSRSLASRIHDAGGSYVEAPVSGSRQPAIAGQLIAMVAGDDAAVERVVSLLDPMCSVVFRCGSPPNALTMKLAVNTFLITLVTGLAESFHFAERHHLDLELLAEILAAGPMSSAVSRAKATKITAQDWTAHASIPDVLKNSNLVVDEARRSQTSSPLMDVCVHLFAEAQRLGHAHEDMAAVIAAIRARTERVSA